MKPSYLSLNGSVIFSYKDRPSLCGRSIISLGESYIRVSAGMGAFAAAADTIAEAAAIDADEVCLAAVISTLDGEE